MELISTLKGHRFPPVSAAFQRSGNLALTGSLDAVILWETTDWSRFRILNAGPGVQDVRQFISLHVFWNTKDSFRPLSCCMDSLSQFVSRMLR